MLFDTEAVEALPSSYLLYDFVGSLLKARDLVALRFAFLTHDDLKNDMRFLETVAVNRGIVAKYFLDRPQALTWLKQ